MITEKNLTMLCDFYELTMGNGYFKCGYSERMTYFDVFFRSVPDKGGFAIAAGLEQVVEYIQNLHFSKKDLAYLRGRNLFDEAFSCMKKAHEELQSEASGQALLGALYLMVPREEFTKRAAFEGFSEGEIFSFLGEAEAIVPEKKSLPVVELKREYDRENS